jgi:hypothetical protein
MITPSERTRAIGLANALLDRTSADPDDDLAVLSRQLLRATERADKAEVRVARLEEALELIAATLPDDHGWLTTVARAARAALAEPAEPKDDGDAD